MTSVVLATAGLLLIGIVAADTLMTVLGVSRRSGPLTRLVTHAEWRLIRHRRVAGITAGLFVTGTVMLAWVLLLLLGWFLLFSADPTSVVHTTGETLAGGWDRLYFVGFTVFTLGIGDLRPVGPLWQMATVVASGSGLALVTLSIAYLMPLRAAVTAKRTLARQLRSMGVTGEQMLIRAWDGSSFGLLGRRLMDVTLVLMELAEQHVTYPVLHLFHGTDETSAFAPALAALHDALRVLADGVDPSAAPPVLAIEEARAAIATLLSTLPQAHATPTDRDPPMPDLRRLVRAGVPLRREPSAIFAGDTEQRRRLLAMVEHGRWQWPTGDRLDAERTEGVSVAPPSA